MSNTIYMIDRNIISKIKDNFKDVKPEKIARIKSLDRKGVTISLLFAIIEGNKGSPQTISEAFDGIKKEIEYLPDFFKNAKVDIDFFQYETLLSATAAADQQPRDFKRYAQLVQFMKENLYRKLKKAERIPILKKIGEVAEQSQVERGNLITLCGIASLYGNRNAFDVLKPKPPSSEQAITEKRAYNAIADLMTIPRMAGLKRSLNVAQPNARIFFKTLDSGLEEFAKEIAILNHKSTAFPGHTIQETTIGVNKSLFPDLNLAEFEELKAWLGKGPEPLIVL
ncbi:hypothetical protein V2I68_09750 [Pseudomonas viridiflava]|uniref:Uncharacterized protein n=1 Tax=Pseudomonas viridiflava TaxID=33069 RepID=A0ABU7N8H6_PSEVI|nr:hypothetical protein [Pseudomonas viridiflava]MEE4041243.1 hypothetical protein [Pseudomonas viridiflava]MEE4061483.1 hypothetical protein [Pseudomonas viridiflava]MEE4170888.1 hypothetical protein [Pseudomonas viridiflava]